LGLTGLVVSAKLRLKPVGSPFVAGQSIKFGNLDEFFALSAESAESHEYVVSWIDCLGRGETFGRGHFLRANGIGEDEAARRHARKPKALPLAMPVTPPLSLVNGLTLRAFNAFYYNRQIERSVEKVWHLDPFHYPLDAIANWNRMYGPKGFFQHQCVVPRRAGRDAVQAMLGEIARSGSGSFLAVLKTFGNRESAGMMSFPMPGVTLALDFPNNGERTLKLFERLDAIVREAGGRIYAAKDARMSRQMFEAGYPRIGEFMKYRDPGISSALSRRLIGS
jgi:FAD/FMN-containing dehydrogenase